MKVTTLDAIMHICYEDDINDVQTDSIVEVWKKRGDHRIGLE